MAMLGRYPTNDYGEERESRFGCPFTISSPHSQDVRENDERGDDGGNQFSVLTALVDGLRKSIVCGAGTGEDGAVLEIGWPTDVRHVAHVTFDRFDGFLGLPVELELDVPHSAPSASVSIFGVSPRSMQCSYDNKGNSVPTILLLMQSKLYSQGGLQAEGIFRINAENSQEVYVRELLSSGVVPHRIDVHCLAGLIKAWFRELPTGVLDSITPDQMMHCNTDVECFQLVKMLPPTEAALLDWAINLMADVVEHEGHNKMNARNIAMVFAPNMTQMTDPLTALIHAVQVMNFLKTLVTKTLREREDTSAEARGFDSCFQSPSNKDEIHSSESSARTCKDSHMNPADFNYYDSAALGKFLFSTEHAFDSNAADKFPNLGKNSETEEKYELASGKFSPTNRYMVNLEDDLKAKCRNRDVESLLDRLNFKRSVRKLCRHPMFQFSKSVKKSGELAL
ncbi:Rho GTPase activation protein [Dioscorea alata]|uniref:Rho GTPase activation protein n=1 Tax=Dioscorea alata TaxID=55571 RepID=A0ACB7UVC0_DIOAL|nr:Rho GTPase activation protein [Dioscorea alata]